MRTLRHPPVAPIIDRRTLLRLVGFAALLLGAWAAWLYHDAGLTLSHYDTKGHLVVARRVIDSLTPGWQQLGALWLPLPHLLNLIPVQVDAFYRTGASAVALSVCSYAIGVVFAARIGLQTTGSPAGALTAAAILALNPDVLYLQSTPMTEALLLALTLVAMSLSLDWLRDDTPTSRRRASLALAALCLTRYEAWPFTMALLVVSVVSLGSSGVKLRDAVRRAAALALYPAIALAAFLVQSRLTVGSWFVTSGFFVADNLDTGSPFRAIGSVWWGTHKLVGTAALTAAMLGVAAGTFIALRDRRRRPLLTLLALFAVGVLPAYAFFKGHPFRVRYMTPLVPAVAIYGAVLVGVLGAWWRRVAAIALVVLVVYQTRPLQFDTPMLLEAQWDSGNSAARRAITRYLGSHYDGRTILASMGSLAHFMQETSAAGIHLKDFLHEGNGDLWQAAIENPRPFVGWIAIEEWSEGGDQLARRARESGRFLEGFDRVAEGGGVALYRAGKAGRAGAAGGS